MKNLVPHILLLEPYHGGSHRAFLEGLQKHLPFRFTLVSLPARKWKMRMQLAAPWMADQTLCLLRDGLALDGVICSTFLDVATYRAILALQGVNLPIAVYCHENQFAYPNRVRDPSWFQFTALNFTSALAADAIAFNSSYNRDTFFDGVAGYLNKAADMEIVYKVEELKRKSVVLYPGLDFDGFEHVDQKEEGTAPVIVWNHRWEHDKDPETFFRTLQDLSGQGLDFGLIVLGKHFERCPGIFARSRKTLDRHILHYGYAPDRQEYVRLLGRADIAVSTAVHEFFGMAVLEAVRCGCRPLVPDRLSYRELFPETYRYREGTFPQALSALLEKSARLGKKKSRSLTDRYSWKTMARKYEEWLLSLL